MANTSPEPFSNWVLSLGGDVFVLGLGYLALAHPVAAFVVALATLVGIVVSSFVLARAAVRWLTRRAQTPAVN
jgi:hypothetical protein